MQISVLMPFRNGAATIEAAIRSLMGQRSTNFEVLLVDDGSTDDSRRIAERLASEDRRLRVVGDERPLGLSARLNQCVDLATGALLARMDCDDVAHPDRLGAQADALEADATLDLIGCRVVVLESDEPLGVRCFPTTHAAITSHAWRGIPLAHPTFMARAVWMRRHRYDEDYERAQDQELLLRTRAASTFANLDQPLLGYREPAPSPARDASQRFRRAAVRRHVGVMAALRLCARDMLSMLAPRRVRAQLEPLAPAAQDAWRQLARTGRWPDPPSAS